MRAALLLALVVVLSAVCSTARADTFAVVPDATQAFASAAVPNNLALLLVPISLTTPPAQPEQLSQPALEALWRNAGATYAVPWQVLAAINKIESDFGRNMGPSSAGAIGWMQFIPDTWLRWGTDGNGDGVADPWNAADAITSAARYLAAAGGATDIRRAIYAYNHADWYVNEVLALAQTYGSGGAPAVFSIDEMQAKLDEAQTKLAAASVRLADVQGPTEDLRAVQAMWLARAANTSLFSDRLVAEQKAVLAGVEVDQAEATVQAAQAEVDAAQQELEQARTVSSAASFSPGAGALLGAPVYAGSYVFPVGGGPDQVSVGHTHHDYPAADIAAPEGAPVYALANAVVLQLVNDGRCGLGLVLRTDDGQEWVYCHLSYVEPGLAVGGVLAAGAPVGLVGHTGDATGPHLHLGLHPASYPQDQSWFASLAGTAFRWQDAAAPDSGRTLASMTSPAGALHPVFSVVPAAPIPSETVVGFSLQGA